MDVVEIARSRFLLAQKLYRFTSTPQFQKAVNAANQDQLMILKLLVETGDVEKLKVKTRQILNEDVESKPTSVLRQMARGYGIKNYSSLPKSILLAELLKRIEDVKRHDDSEEFGDLSSIDESIGFESGDQGREIQSVT